MFSEGLFLDPSWPSQHPTPENFIAWPRPARRKGVKRTISKTLFQFIAAYSTPNPTSKRRTIKSGKSYTTFLERLRTVKITEQITASNSVINIHLIHLSGAKGLATISALRVMQWIFHDWLHLSIQLTAAHPPRVGSKGE